MKYFNLIFILLLSHLYANDNYYYKNHKRENLTKLSTTLRTNSNLQYYETSEGNVVGISDGLILKLKKDDNLQKYLLEFHLSLKKVLSKKVYLLKADNKSLTLFITNRLSEKEDVEYAHPDFVQKQRMR